MWLAALRDLIYLGGSKDDIQPALIERSSLMLSKGLTLIEGE